MNVNIFLLSFHVILLIFTVAPEERKSAGASFKKSCKSCRIFDITPFIGPCAIK